MTFLDIPNLKVLDGLPFILVGSFVNNSLVNMPMCSKNMALSSLLEGFPIDGKPHRWEASRSSVSTQACASQETDPWFISQYHSYIINP